MAEFLAGFAAGCVVCAIGLSLFWRTAPAKVTGKGIILMDGDEVIGTIKSAAVPPEFWEELPRTLDRREPVEGNPGLFNEATYRRGNQDLFGRYIYHRIPGGRVVAPFHSE